MKKYYKVFCIWAIIFVIASAILGSYLPVESFLWCQAMVLFGFAWGASVISEGSIEIIKRIKGMVPSVEEPEENEYYYWVAVGNGNYTTVGELENNGWNPKQIEYLLNLSPTARGSILYKSPTEWWFVEHQEYTREDYEGWVKDLQALEEKQDDTEAV